MRGGGMAPLTKDSKMDMDNHPVLIGFGRLTDKGFKTCKTEGELERLVRRNTPARLLRAAARAARRDAGLSADQIVELITDVALVQMQTETDMRSLGMDFYEDLPQFIFNGFYEKDDEGDESGRVTNQSPKAIVSTYTTVGGNSPQMLLNEFADRIAKGTCKGVLVTGGEALATLHAAARAKVPIPWGACEEENSASSQVLHKKKKEQGVTVLGDKRLGLSLVEIANKAVAPRQIYPMIEQIYRRYVKEHDLATHVQYTARLLAEKFNPVASSPENAPYSWFPQRRTQADVATPSPNNRWIGYPYTKLMNAVMKVNQFGALIMTSEREARRLGVPPEKMIYLAGCGDAYEPCYDYTTRPDLHASYAMRKALHVAQAQAGITSREVSRFDIYSCFPIAVEMACDYLGIHDPVRETRPLTTTGGLMYYGGPGSAYTLFGVGTMMHQLRERKRVTPNLVEYGLVNANGMWVSKHSAGVYCTSRPRGPFRRVPPKETQAELMRESPAPLEVDHAPNGKGVVETYTVDHARTKQLIVVGRMEESGKRFLATTKDEKIMAGAMAYDLIGAEVAVSTPPGQTASRIEALLTISML